MSRRPRRRCWRGSTGALPIMRSSTVGLSKPFRHCERSAAIQFLCLHWIASSQLRARQASGLSARATPRNDVVVPITRLALTDFRNYTAALIEPVPGFVLLSGDNGAGKTNVLEAVSLLTPGRGLRGAALSEMARSGGPGGFGVSARLI